VRPDNEAAVRLYESLGFRAVGVHRAEGVSSVSMALDS
jgi:ribosomal protein S18 acetylase RimI-like enzyme